MRSEDGSILMWVGSSTDVHDLKTALERELQLEKTAARLSRQREELLALNKAKDEFISLASHQLRTPATGVKQFLGMVLEGYTGDISDQQKVFLERAYDSNNREIAIINDLLKVAQVDAGKVVLRTDKTDLVSLIQGVIEEQVSKFKDRNQTVIFEPKTTRLYADVDKARIRMVLENIIDNASKYTRQGKTITVEIRKSKDKLRVSVKDQGVGIAPEDIKRLFEKFSRIDNPLSTDVGGTGLGLYWAKKIIDLHGGTIEVSSKPDEGTAFTIVLPL